MDGKLDWIAAGLPVEGTMAGRQAVDFARRDVPTCRLDEPIGAVRERVRAAGWDVCVVVNQEGVVMGLLTDDELGQGDGESAEEVMRPGPTTSRPHVSIGTMAHHMLDHDRPRSLITTSDGRLVGVLRREDALAAAHGDDEDEES